MKKAVLVVSSVFFVVGLFLTIPATSVEPGNWEPEKQIPGPDQHPPELMKISQEFRSIRGWGSGVPEFAAVVQKQKEMLKNMRERLDQVNPSNWDTHFKIDYLLLRAEMDSLEFDLYVRRPTSRDPSFYVNRAIGNVNRLLTGGRRMGENPTLMPYPVDKARDIIKALNDTENFLAQGRKNLTEMVPELADIALEHPGGGYYTEGGQLKHIAENYRKWAEITAKHFPSEEAKRLVPAAIEAGRRLMEFGNWIEDNRNNMSGKAHFGKPIVDWYFKHVLMLPYDSDQIRDISEIRRVDALSHLAFEMHKNRHLPPISPAKTAKEYLAWDDETALILRRWYLDKGLDLLSDQEYQPLIRSEEGMYLLPFGIIAFPYEPKPGIHRIVVVPDDHWRAEYSNMGFRTDPAVLHGHEYWPGHTYESYFHRKNPCPIRGFHRNGAHSEGWCFYHEILPVIMDFPYVRGPRARELVYINMLQRASRNLVGIPLLLGEITFKEAMRLHMENTPPLGPGLGVRPEEAFEEMEGWLNGGSISHHCQIGLLQIHSLLADCHMLLKDKFDLKEFNDQYMRYGQIPISLLRWEILGDEREAKSFWKPTRLSTVLPTQPK